MSIQKPNFPTEVWDGTSESRDNRLIDRSPDYFDWDQLVAELIATQQAIVGIPVSGQTTYSLASSQMTLPGQAVCFSGSQLVLAKADASETSYVAGVVFIGGMIPFYITSGKLLLPDWMNSTGASTLTPGAIYYLHPNAAGRLITLPPTTEGQYLTKVGQAQSETVLDVNIAPPIRL